MDEHKRYYVLRIKPTIGGDNCSECKEWEYLVNSEGGAFFGEEDIKKSSNPDSTGHTGLFHPHCKCTLVESIGQPITDEVDSLVVFTGALSHAKYGDLPEYQRVRIVTKV